MQSHVPVWLWETQREELIDSVAPLREKQQLKQINSLSLYSPDFIQLLPISVRAGAPAIGRFSRHGSESGGIRVLVRKSLVLGSHMFAVVTCMLSYFTLPLTAHVSQCDRQSRFPPSDGSSESHIVQESDRRHLHTRLCLQAHSLSPWMRPSLGVSPTSNPFM